MSLTDTPENSWIDFEVNAGAYWDTFFAPYRTIACQIASRETPQNSSLLDYGCGPGVTLARLHLMRPDLRLIGLDVSVEALQLGARLISNGPCFVLGKGVELPPQVSAHTLLSVYTLAYLEAFQVKTLFRSLPETVRTLVLMEPHLPKDEPVTNKDPSTIYSHKYDEILKWLWTHESVSWKWGWEALFDPKVPELHRVLVAHRG